MSPSSSRNFSKSSRMVSTRVFKRTMRFLMRRILSSRSVVTCCQSASMLVHEPNMMLMNSEKALWMSKQSHKPQFAAHTQMLHASIAVAKKMCKNRATYLTVCTVGLLSTGSPALHSSSVIPDSLAQTYRRHASSDPKQDCAARHRRETATENCAMCHRSHGAYQTQNFTCLPGQGCTVSSTTSRAFSSKGVSSYDL